MLKDVVAQLYSVLVSTAFCVHECVSEESMNKVAQAWKDFLSNWDTLLGIVGGLLVGLVSFILGTFFNRVNVSSVLSLTLVMLGILAVSIRRDRRTEEIMQQSLGKISEATQGTFGTVKSLTINRAFEEQREAYRYLIDVISKYGAKKVVFIQYSCHTGLDVLRTALSAGAKATVFIQHEEIVAKMGSQLQANRIVETARSFRNHLGRSLSNPEDLKVYKYTTPGSISAIKIDERVLCMGWYTYEKVDYAHSQHYNSDQISVSGHDRAAVVVWEGTDAFKALNSTFMLIEQNYRENAQEFRI